MIARSRAAGCLALIATGLVSPETRAFASQQPAELPVVRLEGVHAPQSSGTAGLPVTRLDDGPAATDLDGVRAVSLTFSQPLAVRDVLFLLFRGTPFSVVIDADVSGSFAGELSAVSLREALDAVLAPAGLEYQRHGRVVRITTKRRQTRLFEVSHLDIARSWRRRASSAKGGGTADTELTVSSESSFFAELSEGMAALLSPAGRVHVDANAGVVQVTDFAEQLQQAGIYVETITLRASRQVRLSAHVLDVALGNNHQAIDWTVVGRSAGIGDQATRAGVYVADFDVLLRALGAFGTVRTIASPQLLAMNNQPAVMLIGPAGATFAAADAAGTAGAAASSLTLAIVPQISADGFVHMSVSPAYVDERGSRPDVSAAAIDSVMRVRGGETVVIAGLVRAGVEVVTAGGSSGPPERRDVQRTRHELVILITPTIVTAGSSPILGVR